MGGRHCPLRALGPIPTILVLLSAVSLCGGGGAWGGVPGQDQRGGKPRILPVGSAIMLARAVLAAREPGASGAEEELFPEAIAAQLTKAALGAPVLEPRGGEQGGIFESSEMPGHAFTMSMAVDSGKGRRALHKGGDGGAQLRAGDCALEVTEVATAWNLQEFMLMGKRIDGTPDVVAVTNYDTLSQLRDDYKTAHQYPWYTPPISKLGIQIVRVSMLTGVVAWASGLGKIGFADGDPAAAEFSADVSGLAVQPVCRKDEVANGLCAASARQGLFSANRWMYVADQGNCAVRLVDMDTGVVATKWGSQGCLQGAPLPGDYVDSVYASDVELSGSLDVLWVGWRFLMVLDGGARRIRKFVTSQHQGLSNLAGGGNDDACISGVGLDGPGDAATFCLPVAMAAASSGGFVVVAEKIIPTSNNVQRLRLLTLTYGPLSPGGDVTSVSCVVTTLTSTAYGGGGNTPSYLFSPFGGLALSPAATVSDGSIFAGSFDRDAVDTQDTRLVGYPIIAVSISDLSVTELNAGGTVLSGRTLIDAAPDPTDGGVLLLTLAKHTFQEHLEQEYTNIQILFQIPRTSLVTVALNVTAAGLASSTSGACASALSLSLLEKRKRQSEAAAARHVPPRDDHTLVGVIDEGGRVRVVDLALLQGLGGGVAA